MFFKKALELAPEKNCNWCKSSANEQMSVKHMRKFSKLSDESMYLLKTVMEKINVSARAYDKGLEPLQF